MIKNGIVMIGVSKNYRDKHVLNNVNITIEKGKIVGLVGPNGAGKTTLMSILLGFIQTFSGEVLVDGKSRSMTTSTFGCLIEEPSFYPELTGYENLKYFSAFLDKKRNNNISELITLLHMESFVHKKVKSYSLGMKQLLGIAIAMLGEPDYLILDEPLNGIDAKKIPEIREIVKRVAKEKKTGILISSHLLSEIEMVCNRALILNEGEVVKNLTLCLEANANKKCDYIITTDEVDDVLHYLKEGSYDARLLNGKLLVTVEDNTVEDVLRDLILSGYRIKEISKWKESLEEEFLQAIKGDL